MAVVPEYLTPVPGMFRCSSTIDTVRYSSTMDVNRLFHRRLSEGSQQPSLATVIGGRDVRFANVHVPNRWSLHFVVEVTTYKAGVRASVGTTRRQMGAVKHAYSFTPVDAGIRPGDGLYDDRHLPVMEKIAYTAADIAYVALSLGDGPTVGHEGDYYG